MKILVLNSYFYSYANLRWIFNTQREDIISIHAFLSTELIPAVAIARSAADFMLMLKFLKKIYKNHWVKVRL